MKFEPRIDERLKEKEELEEFLKALIMTLNTQPRFTEQIVSNLIDNINAYYKGLDTGVNRKGEGESNL